ncbi:MAG: NAD-dependent epimerase/dehydratase family protein [Actinomycetota bacterium]|nr:NAD-dependent epimerase/dehydratase family protein [Actinomycetota bacterium]
MTAVVTGASGFLGGAVVRHLLESGQEVRAVDIRKGPTLDGLDVDYVHGDVLDPSTLEASFSGADVVYHLVGLISITGDPHGKVRRLNVEGVRNVARAALHSGASRMVHCSSVHAYDLAAAGDGVTEHSPRSTAPGLPPYDRSKAAGEAALREVVDEGLDAVIVNPTGIIGPYDHEPSRMGHVLLALFEGRLPALLDAGFDWVDSRDVARGLAAAAQDGRHGQNYLLPGHHRTIPELARITENVSGTPAPKRMVPLGLAKTLAPLGDLIVRRTGSPLWYTRESLHALINSPEVAGEKASSQLGYEPRPIEETIEDIYEWFASNGQLGAGAR